jgi:dipeptidyl aminopeptidase/acylaminoacyl peptidase
MFSPRRTQRLLLLFTAALIACSGHKPLAAQPCFIPHPDNPAKSVEYFVEKPSGNGPWPTVVFLHGHQEWPFQPGGKDFVKWGVLHDYASKGYFAVAVSQPGYGKSDGPADFCGPFSQHAVSGVIAKLRAEGLVAEDKIVVQGVSRGAMLAGLVAAHDPSIAGVVMISGEYDLTDYIAHPKSAEAKLIAHAIKSETGGSESALRERSLLYVLQDLDSGHAAGSKQSGSNQNKTMRAEALILNGARDDRTDPDQARRLADVIVAGGGKARAIIYPQFGHQISREVRGREIDTFMDRILH